MISEPAAVFRVLICRSLRRHLGTPRYGSQRLPIEFMRANARSLLTPPALAPTSTAGRVLPAILLALAGLIVIGLAIAALSGAFNADRTALSATPTAITPVRSNAAAAPAADRQALNAALQQAISDNRIIAPIENNAMTALRDLIALDPNDRNAQTTLLELFPFAVQAIEGSLERGELELAESQITLLGQTGHSSNSLLLLSDKLRAQRSSTARIEDAQTRAQAAVAASQAPSDRPSTPAPAVTPAPLPTPIANPAPAPSTPASASVSSPPTTAANPDPSTTTNQSSASQAAVTPVSAPVETVPVQIGFADPLYPPRARSRRIEGEVELAFTIDRNGEPRDIQVVRAEPPNTFDREALRAAQRWRFEPGTVNGQPVERRISRVLQFRLGEG